ncbi:DUF4097 family beta strand repeat-containing protein [Paenibacillus sp. GP183]|uniref:DUF4097 family beta strand repeat-containing protein n=1 Tax=Paenibacillus sp. GP183 TaxID=1882751 RepID=UPI00089C7CB3|nr:DUF4097 family beta strand repeat-containing protein [Paenibacillus sp. GP183]SEC35112.1 Putative adhesin [Paenibacillus sp. GP183]
MKLTIKMILLAGFICLIVGVMGAAMILKTTNMETGLANVDLEKKVSAAEIKNLSVDTDITGVVFIPSQTDEICAHLTGLVSEDQLKNTTIDASLSGKETWKVKVKTKSGFNFGFHITDIKSLFLIEKEKRFRVEVELPQKAYNEIQVTTNTGAIDLGDIQADRITAHADTGSISIGRFQGKDINLGTDTGRITMREGEGNVHLKTSTGSIEAALRSAGDTVNIQTDTGGVNLRFLNLPSSANFEISNDTGHIDFTLPNAKYKQNEKHAVTASIGNGGGSSVRVQTATGSIQVR